ncbi:MAG: hypothetical protein A2271_00765 [Candidatus Moranbacteria bacterium RIFOXYA12_FULL_35_19]|nr:MAG: hypothetical protein A2343_01685 [Candidatus Moranbacteria bacterium RIFOXYB12_FULL_35_8]OGI33270.1 MAG: hypothetical protein A2489_01985 [Candidatus Moranbacteria bacterium RIFOXYC12_FULL_36_13]OGI36458.1 MAG: hypothetical protein A2271_00765 [Candidatus Moranbacteria bacterium RIFOXYA12_FULL_35_19]
MTCRVRNCSITDALSSAIEKKDQEQISHLASLIKGGEGVYADDFYSQIGRHPNAEIIRKSVPELF